VKEEDVCEQQECRVAKVQWQERKISSLMDQVPRLCHCQRTFHSYEESKCKFSVNSRKDHGHECKKQKVKDRQRTLNGILVEYLTIAFKSQSNLTIVFETMREDWPGGTAYKVF
jgi:hypothetical protein